MKKAVLIILCLCMFMSNMTAIAAETLKNFASITAWSESYWQHKDTTSVTEGANGIELSQEHNVVKSGKGALKMYVEKTAVGLESVLTQNISGLEIGKYYRLSGDIFYKHIASNIKAHFRIYLGEKRIAFLGDVATPEEWSNINVVFRYGYNEQGAVDNDFGSEFILKISGGGYLYADNLSLKEVVWNDTDSTYVDNGNELIENGDFEFDLQAPSDVSNLVALAGNSEILLNWSQIEDVLVNKIGIYVDGTLIDTIDKTQDSYCIDSLQNGVEYEILIKTISKAGVESQGVAVTGIPHPPYVVPNVIKDDEKNRIIGITEEMEYSLDGIIWSIYDSNNPPLLDGDVSVYVRVHSAYQNVIPPSQVLHFTQNKTENGHLIIKDIRLIENSFSVAGKLKDSAKKKITLLVVKKGFDKRNYDNVLLVGQTESNSMGEFEFNLPVANKRKGNVNDGHYTVYLETEDGFGLDYNEVVFVCEDNRKVGISNLLNSEDPLSLITGSESDVCAAIGINVNDFINYSSDTSNTQLVSAFSNISLTDEEAVKKIVSAAEKTLIITATKDANAEDMYYLLSNYGENAGLSYNNKTIQSLINEGGPEINSAALYMAGKEHATNDDLMKTFRGGCALYYLNNATYGEITGLVENNNKYFDIDSTVISSYLAITGDKADVAAKALVQYKNKTPFTSSTDITNGLKAAIAATQKPNDPPPSSPTVGGNGGGGGSRDQFTTTVPPGFSLIEKDSGTMVDNPFNDLSNVSWAEDSILELYNKGIVSGYGDKLFAPSNNVTREEYLKILVVAFGLEDDTAVCEFSDVKLGTWYYPYVAAAVKNGVVNGISENEFGTGKSITRQDIAVMTYNCLKKAGIASYDVDYESFIDEGKINDYAREAVYNMKKLGIIAGYEDGSFLPQNYATRAEACKICCMAMRIKEGK